jgi:hypothetical protein
MTINVDYIFKTMKLSQKIYLVLVLVTLPVSFSGRFCLDGLTQSRKKNECENKENHRVETSFTFN